MKHAVPTPFYISQLAEELVPSGVDWLDQARHDNREAFAATGLPDTRVEAWKYSPLRALDQRGFSLGDAKIATRAVDPSTLALPGVNGPRLVFVNGALREDLSRREGLPDGLSVQSLAQVLRADPESLRNALGTRHEGAGDAFVQLNAAYARDGVVLRVAPGVKVAEPVHLCFVGAAAEGDVTWHLHNVIELGEGAELSVVEHHTTSGAHAHLGTLVTDITLARDARYRHAALQLAAAGSSLIRRHRITQHAQSHATVHGLELGGAMSRHELEAELTGDGARLETRGAFVLHGRQHADTQMMIRHKALNTASDSVWRGVADDRSRGVFRGAILVAPGADGSDASLSNKNLLLSARAEIDTKPELEIHADEVKAAHGATIGQLDERALFYLRSRGVPHLQARAILTAAFCRAVLDDLPNDALREHLSELVAQHLPQS
ncbi:Fe-S cluster assembly protein SufD [Dyella sp.]|jgi:Fe-S cluster assembly protein SufD|uniref:Fe-S cluster assembly protein SufD n=1 Tax=Dyella sp. TaxID=1869338 RepID=UPI002D77CD9A|nr:Fe-S cluster assembly protein SufD [Dyella sp.]HET6433809.1 Fe-S cluster assembly protein SufD [Dyella sp.]